MESVWAGIERIKDNKSTSSVHREQTKCSFNLLKCTHLMRSVLVPIKRIQTDEKRSSTRNFNANMLKKMNRGSLHNSNELSGH